MKASLLRKPQLKPKTNVNELEKVADPLTRLTPLATLSSKGARAGVQVDAPLAPSGEKTTFDPERAERSYTTPHGVVQL